MKLDDEFFNQGFKAIDLALPDSVQKNVREKNWQALDQWLASETKPQGLIGREIHQYIDQFEMEHIIALRSAPDEDGIWHDDGSRDMAFSLSLNFEPQNISGGCLMLRKKENSMVSERQFPPQPFGKLILFLTGKQGFEHKTCAVTSGERLVAAGWATERSS